MCNLDVTLTDSFGWTRPVGVLQVPDLNLSEFLTAAVEQGSYLTLYAYVLQQLPMSRCLADERKQLDQLLMWNTKVQPRLDEQ